jgi:hypothetical protein
MVKIKLINAIPTIILQFFCISLYTICCKIIDTSNFYKKILDIGYTVPLIKEIHIPIINIILLLFIYCTILFTISNIDNF